MREDGGPNHIIMAMDGINAKYQGNFRALALAGCGPKAARQINPSPRCGIVIAIGCRIATCDDGAQRVFSKVSRLDGRNVSLNELADFFFQR